MNLSCIFVELLIAKNGAIPSKVTLEESPTSSVCTCVECYKFILD